MNTPSGLEQTTPFRVGDWIVNPSSGLLNKDGTEVKLEPKVMEVLVYLAVNQGQVISREALEAKAWAGTIVGYDAVSGSIIKLRKALGDDSRNPQYIKTIPKRGYQLIAPVSQTVGHTPAPASFQTGTSGKVSKQTGKKAMFLTAGFGFTIVIGLLFFLASRPDTSVPPPLPGAKTYSVIVLPFKNLSDDHEHKYLSDGITDDLITDLSRVDSLRVIARQSAYHYRDNPVAREDITRKLNVSYIVEGSVRKSGNHIRINVQLSDAGKGENIWARRFDTDTDNIFTVQDDITRNVMKAMLVTLSGEGSGSIGVRDTKNFEAYDAFLIGQQHIKTRSSQGYELAMNAFRRAIQIDPGYARAYGAMAVMLTRGYRYKWTDISPVEARERALELAKKAVQLNRTTPEIYWSLGYVHIHRQEYDEAETAAEQSVALSPNYADGYALLANIANWRGKMTDAVNYILKAKALNPYYTFQYPSTLGLANYNLGRYEEAVTSLREAIEHNESALNPRLFLAAAYARLDRMEEAAWEIEQINVNRPGLTLSGLATMLPYENKKYLNTLQQDLRKAGLPE